ncbi:MAG TPA: hypothetical protein VGS19_16045 [Streptosporangiaceae bacterium]|nr:hypothetical protein [Streptosporangiaceae bacterium]
MPTGPAAPAANLLNYLRSGTPAALAARIGVWISSTTVTSPPVAPNGGSGCVNP